MILILIKIYTFWNDIIAVILTTTMYLDKTNSKIFIGVIDS